MTYSFENPQHAIEGKFRLVAQNRTEIARIRRRNEELLREARLLARRYNLESVYEDRINREECQGD